MLNEGKAPGPTYPKAWDSRILPYTKIAEKQRGLLFKHPVAVRFLPPEEFEKTVTTDEQGAQQGATGGAQAVRPG